MYIDPLQMFVLQNERLKLMHVQFSDEILLENLNQFTYESLGT